MGGRQVRWLVVAAGVLALAGCGPESAGHDAAGSAPASSAAPTRPSTMDGPTTPSPTRTSPSPRGKLAGDVVVLDAGHNDGNFQHTTQIDRQVRAGGFRKACDTTGTETNDGYTEAAFTYDVTKRLTALLRDEGAKVVLTRADDHSVGPCVDRRANIGNGAHADVAMSIHADGGPADGHGFHIMQPVDGAGHVDSIVAPSHRLALALRDAYRSGTSMPPASYIGTDGINPRGDMAGLNLSTVPKVLVECGNMRNAGDAHLLTTASFRQRIAAALAAGVTRYLRH
ncbi:MAG: N-acetylmuramoyl-L-alanine amidase [Actinocatenispora sp.]